MLTFFRMNHIYFLRLNHISFFQDLERDSLHKQKSCESLGKILSLQLRSVELILILALKCTAFNNYVDERSKEAGNCYFLFYNSLTLRCLFVFPCHFLFIYSYLLYIFSYLLSIFSYLLYIFSYLLCVHSYLLINCLNFYSFPDYNYNCKSCLWWITNF